MALIFFAAYCAPSFENPTIFSAFFFNIHACLHLFFNTSPWLYRRRRRGFNRSHALPLYRFPRSRDFRHQYLLFVVGFFTRTIFKLRTSAKPRAIALRNGPKGREVVLVSAETLHISSCDLARDTGTRAEIRSRGGKRCWRLCSVR